MKLLVITERGRVVGTQPVAPPAGGAHVSAVVRAGPGQTIHEIEVADPGELRGAKAIEAFHRLVAASLRPKKGSRKKKKR